MNEKEDFIGKLRKLIEEENESQPEEGEEFATELTLIDLDDLTDSELELLTDMGVIKWVSAEGEIGVESTVEGEEESAEGNTSGTSSEMLKSGPHDDGEGTVSYATEKGAHALVTIDGEVHKSLYAVGEIVVTLNPYTHEFVHEDLDGTPLYFIITSIAYDSGDGVFRYFIEGEEEWVSEEWLDKPMVSMMSKIFVDITVSENGEITTAMKEPKKSGLQQTLDEFTGELTVNTYLDMMLSDDADVQAYGKEMLTKMASTAEGAQ